MEEEIVKVVEEAAEETWHFVPSHLTLALAASGISLVFGAYAVYEFSKVEPIEIKALIFGP